MFHCTLQSWAGYLLPLPGDLGQFTLRRGPVRPELGWFTFRRTQVTFRRVLVNRAGLRSVAAWCSGLAYVLQDTF